MDILFFLVPFSVLLGLAIVGLLAWAVAAGQFEDLESEGHRILDEQRQEEFLERSRQRAPRPDQHEKA